MFLMEWFLFKYTMSYAICCFRLFELSSIWFRATKWWGEHTDGLSHKEVWWHVITLRHFFFHKAHNVQAVIMVCQTKWADSQGSSSGISVPLCSFTLPLAGPGHTLSRTRGVNLFFFKKNILFISFYNYQTVGNCEETCQSKSWVV